MSRNCTDRERVAAWCAAFAGDDLAERRSELLWQYARGRLDPGAAAELQAHLKSCDDCGQAWDNERLVAAAGAGGKTVLARCPSSEEVLQYLERDPAQSPWRRLEIKRHVDRCQLCREEATWAGEHVVTAPVTAKGPRWAWFSWKWLPAGAAAAVVLAAVLLYPRLLGNQRYARLARVPDVPYEAMLAEFAAAHPDEVPRFRAATEHVRLGEYEQGSAILGELQSRHATDPSIQFFRGYVAVREGRWEEATLLCTRAEKSSLDGFRCWYLANVALKAGDLPLARKEIRHAKGHAPYREAAQRLEQQVN